MDVFGVVGLSAVVVIVIAACVAAAVFLRRRSVRQAGEGRRGQAAFPGQSRLEVLDTTDVDADRRLILVRCDGIEHLLMTGGPSDVVVENDVRRVRGAAAAVERMPPAGQDRDRSLAAFAAPSTPPARQRTAETNRPPPRPAPPSPDQAATAPRSSSLSAPAARAVTQPPRPEPQRVETPRPERRNPQLPAPAAAARAVEPARALAKAPLNGGDRQPRPAAPALPGATTPWPEPDSLENEIVQALRFERKAEQNGAAPPDPEPVERERKDSAATTLGDLAERLEEALAREVQSTSQLRGIDSEPEPMAPEEKPEAATLEARKRLEPRQRTETKDSRQESARPLMPVPDAETRRDTPHVADRREEAPVISLNSRRREAVDPLEDEMARLLGELTGDTKGR